MALQQKTISAEKRDLETKLAQKEAKIRELHNELRSMSERLAEETSKTKMSKFANFKEETKIIRTFDPGVSLFRPE